MKFFEWFTDLFPKSEKSTLSILDAFDGASEEVQDFVKDIKDAINEDEKQFLVEIRIGKDTKVRPLKASIEASIADMLVKQYPECGTPTVKSFYRKNA